MRGKRREREGEEEGGERTEGGKEKGREERRKRKEKIGMIEERGRGVGHWALKMKRQGGN